MILRFKLVRQCLHNHRGEFVRINDKTFEIRISRKLNKNVNEFLTTLLHELLHFWVTVAQTHGLEISYRKEHRFIFNVVPTIIHRLIKFKGASNEKIRGTGNKKGRIRSDGDN